MWKEDFGWEYADHVEEAQKFAVWIDKWARVNEWNKDYDKGDHMFFKGVNQFR